jgi:hypothetical protein
MSDDISDILKNWKYDPDNTIRIITADDGRKIMQVRQPLGLEQYELDCRPDGKRPYGKETVLEEMLEKKSTFEQKHPEGEGFVLSKEDLQLLQNEGVLIYYRYLHLFQIGDYARTIRDTDHNLKLCHLVDNHAEDREEANAILQYQPYILRVNAIARAMVSLQEELNAAAREVLENAIAKIKEMPEIDTPAFQFEKIRSLNYLRVALKQVLEKKEDPVEQLKRELKEAIDAEEYERAALIRDQLQEFEEE